MTTTPNVSLQQVAAAQQTAIALAEADAAAKAWADRAKELKAELMAFHNEGVIPSKFEESGVTFSLQQGRTSIVLDDLTKARIAELQAEALEEGRAIKKQGDAFWSLKVAK